MLRIHPAASRVKLLAQQTPASYVAFDLLSLDGEDLLDRPFSELTGERLIELHQQIKDKAAKRTGTNPANDKGAPLANRVIAHVSASWRSLNKKLECKLGSWNPASAVDRVRRQRVALDGHAEEVNDRLGKCRPRLGRSQIAYAPPAAAISSGVITCTFAAPSSA